MYCRRSSCRNEFILHRDDDQRLQDITGRFLLARFTHLLKGERAAFSFKYASEKRCPVAHACTDGPGASSVFLYRRGCVLILPTTCISDGICGHSGVPILEYRQVPVRQDSPFHIGAISGFFVVTISSFAAGMPGAGWWQYSDAAEKGMKEPLAQRRRGPPGEAARTRVFALLRFLM